MDKGMLTILIVVIACIVFGLILIQNAEGYNIEDVVEIDQIPIWVVGEDNEINIRLVTYMINFNGTMFINPIEDRILVVLIGDSDNNVVWEDWGVTEEGGYLNYTLSIDEVGEYRTVVIEDIYEELNRWDKKFTVIE